MSFNLKTALTSIAPTLATMLGGPLAGTAVTALEHALGVEPGAGADAVTKVVQAGMTPEQIAAVRAADQKHAEVMAQQGIDLAKLNADHEAAMAQIDETDRASARQREEKVGGWTTPILAWLVVLASVGLGYLVVSGRVTSDPKLTTLAGTVIGYVFSEAKQVLSYYFGTTSDSQQKNTLLAKANPPK